MARSFRMFCLGAVFTTLSWICITTIYLHIDKKASSSIQGFGPKKLIPRKPVLHHLNHAPDDPLFRHQIDDPRLQKPHSDVSELGIIKDTKDQILRDKGYRQHAFNQLISDRLSFHRQIIDTRHRLCKEKQYHNKLPTASIVICFYNEAWSSLLRTVYSVLDRTPGHLLHEILLVDDSSHLVHLKTKLDDYTRDKLPKVKVVHTGKREGLIRARMLGASHATGDVLIFLDSHCEVNIGWIEPLLDRIAEDHTNVAIPIIDMINSDTFEYQASPLVRGGFNWGMHFRWDPIPSAYLKTEQDHANPIKSPTMAGGLFAMSRTYFNELGKYDEGMDVWGGENLEISFRVWQCGGHMDIIPCSRVGHIFRSRRPYGAPGDTMMKNSLRVAHVWMDEYKEHYFQINPQARKMDYGDISDRLAIRKRLQCKSFKWYLQNVYPEQVLPGETGKLQPFLLGQAPMHKEKKQIIQNGLLRHMSSDLCVVSYKESHSKGAQLMLSTCDTADKNQIWVQTRESELILADLLCLDTSDSDQETPHIMKCHGSHGSQAWKWIGENSRKLYNPASGKCLGVMKEQLKGIVTMELCSSRQKVTEFIISPNR